MTSSNLPTASSDPSYSKQKTTDLPWYLKDISIHSTPEFRNLLQKTSKIPAGEISSHVQNIHSKLWSLRTYPCIGLGTWQIPWLQTGFFYPSLLSVLRSSTSTRFLDLGCFIGYDMRLLADDGISATQLVGIDIVDFWGLGFELFRDQESEFGKAAKFSKGDILDLDSLERGLGDDGKVDVVYVSQVLHQFDVERQVAAAKNLLAVTRGPGSLIVGAQIGYQTGRESLMKVPPGEPQPWMHDGGSWAELWRRVEREMGMELKVETRLREREEYRMDRETTKFMGEDMRVLEFQVTRVK